MAYNVRISLTRPSVDVGWDEHISGSDQQVDPFDVVMQAIDRGIYVGEYEFSEDLLTRTLDWIAPNEEVWSKFSREVIFANTEEAAISRLKEYGLTLTIEKWNV